MQNRNNANTNILKNIIIDKANLEGMANLENIFPVQTLLREYAPCEHNNIDEVRYFSQGLTKTVQHTQVNKS